MKILLLGFGKISYMPYMHFYIDKLVDCDLHLIYWDRDGKADSEVPKNIKKSFKFSHYFEEQVPLRRKLKGFAKYRRFAKTIIKREKYDFIIVLHSTPGVTIVDYLLLKYKNKYILDYRDISLENYSFYKKIIELLVNNSFITFISSDGFRKFIPESNKVRISHNVLLDSLKYRNIRSSTSREVTPLRIRYWGLIRHLNANMKLIRSIANDERFQLHYHGREQEVCRQLKTYCIDNNVNNVHFHGEYFPIDRYEFAAQTDIIHNLYDNDLRMNNATANKLYDGIIFKLPQLCMQGSHMSKLTTDYGLGLACNLDSEEFSDQIFNYYNGIDWDRFEKSCDDYLEKIIEEYDEGVRNIQKIMP